MAQLEPLTAPVADLPGIIASLEEDRARIDRELAENTLVFPDDATRARLSGYPNLSIEDEQRMNEAFQQVTGA